MRGKIWLRTNKGFCFSLTGSQANGKDDPCYVLELTREDGAVKIVTASELLNALVRYEEWMYDGASSEWLVPFLTSKQEPKEPVEA